MNRWGILIGCGLAVVGFYLLFDHSRDAYKIIPVDAGKPLTFAAHETWVNYDAPAGFIAKFPFVPQRATNKIEDEKTNVTRLYDMYVSQENSGRVFMVSVITFVGDNVKPDDQELMRTMVMEMVERKEGNTLAKMDPTTFEGKPALEFNVNGKQAAIEGVVFVIGKRLYLLSEVVPVGLQPEGFDYFKDEFHLKKAGS